MRTGLLLQLLSQLLETSREGHLGPCLPWDGGDDGRHGGGCHDKHFRSFRSFFLFFFISGMFLRDGDGCRSTSVAACPLAALGGKPWVYKL